MTQLQFWAQIAIYTLFSGGSVAAITLAVAVLRRLNRDESLRQDFPPHRHINGKILYPRDYEPAVVEKLQEQS